MPRNVHKEEDETEFETELETETETETAIKEEEQLFDEGLIYGMDEGRKKPNMAFDEGLIYGVDIFQDAQEVLLEEDYDSGLITDDAEERFRATNMAKATIVQNDVGKAKRKKGSVKFNRTVLEISDEDDSGLITDEAEENYRIVYMDKEVQTEEIRASRQLEAGKHEAHVDISTSKNVNVNENDKIVVEGNNTTDDGTTDQAPQVRSVLKDDSDDGASTTSRASTPTPMPRNRLAITKKVSQQVSESEYENTTADEKPPMLVRRKVIETALKRLDRTRVVEKIPIKRSTVSLADTRDRSPGEASDSYDADYESYDDDGDPYEPSEISFTDTIICVGFGYALVYA